MTSGGPVSRRGFVGLGIASALPRRAAAADEEPAPKPPNAIDTVTDRHSHLTLPVFLDGKGPFRFVVDTGADRTVVADTAAAALGLDRRGNVVVAGVSRSVSAETIDLEKIAFGDFVVRGLTLPVLPYQWLKADGYLGLDVLDGRCVTFDFENGRLQVEDSTGFKPIYGRLKAEIAVPTLGSAGHLRALNCHVDGVRTAVFIDSGAEVSMGNMPLYLALRRLHPKRALEPPAVKISGVTGGEVDGWRMRFDRIRIRNLELMVGVILVADLQIFDMWGLADQPALLLGMNFLRQFNRVGIDFGYREFRFKVASLSGVEQA